MTEKVRVVCRDCDVDTTITPENVDTSKVSLYQVGLSVRNTHNLRVEGEHNVDVIRQGEDSEENTTLQDY